MIIPDTFRLQRNALLLSTLRRLARDEQGGSLVETALSFLLMLTLIFGVIEGSLAVYNYHFLASAAHEAARYAIVRSGGWGTPCDGSGSLGSGYGSSACWANTTDVANYVANRNFPGINIAATDVCVRYFGTTPASSVTPCTSFSSVDTGNTPGHIVQVTINHQFPLGIPGVPFTTINMSSTSQMTIYQ